MVNYKDYELKNTSRERESIEWTITYSFHTERNDLPRVLLIGDSICHGYSSKVNQKLDGKCNVTYWASSKCVTDKDYFRELDFILDGYKFDIVSFNNGLHSLFTDREEWKAAYRSAVEFIQAKCPNAKVYLTLSTPVENEENNERCIELNLPVKAIAEEKLLPVIDLYSPIKEFENEKPWSDGVHFKEEYVELQSKIVADTVKNALKI